MKQMLLLGAALVALAGCNKRVQPEEQALAEITIDTAGTMPATMTRSSRDDTADLNESADNRTETSEPEEKEKEEEEDPNASRQILEYVNWNSNNDIYVFRDTDTGCEFIQVEKSGHLVVIERPNGTGGHRGCKTGTDFVKPKKEEQPK